MKRPVYPATIEGHETLARVLARHGAVTSLVGAVREALTGSA